MPRSSIGMAEYDTDYCFNVDSYLCKNYPSITKPHRRGICDWVRTRIDEEDIKELIDQIVLEYALEQQGWTPKEDENDEQ